MPERLVCNKGVDVEPPELELKRAVTVVLALMVNAQEPLPLQAPPLQPANVLPAAGVALMVAIVPGAIDSVQVLPQLMAPPDRVTVPVPVPIFAIESVTCGVDVNVAATLLAAFMLTVQDGVLPVHAPLHPLKLFPGFGVAVSVTLVPVE